MRSITRVHLYWCGAICRANIRAHNEDQTSGLRAEAFHLDLDRSNCGAGVGTSSFAMLCNLPFPYRCYVYIYQFCWFYFYPRVVWTRAYVSIYNKRCARGSSARGQLWKWVVKEDRILFTSLARRKLYDSGK